MSEYTIKVVAADKLHVQDSDTTILSVQFEIKRDGETIETRRHGFPLDASPENVETELQTFLEAYVRDIQVAESKAEFAAANAQADETIAEIVGKEITG